MADDSSFMDWQPQTPPPLFNPYQGDYMPGGWPQQPPTPPFRTTGLFDPPRRRTRLEEYLLPVLPAAKRVCTGLIRATINATATIVTVPTYAIVRQVRHLQQARRARPQPQQAPRRSAVQARRPVRRVVVQTPPPRPPPQQEAVLVTPPITPPQQETVLATPLSKQIQEHTAAEEIPFEVPEFRPAHLLRKANKNVAPKKVIQRRRLKDAFPGMPHILPPTTSKSVTLQTPEQVVPKPLPEAGSIRLHSPFPQFAPGPATPPSPPSPAGTVTTTESVTPSAQLQKNLSAVNDSDSDGNTVVSSVTTSRKRRIDIQGSRAPESHSAKRFQTAGPSVNSPNTPTPNPTIVVQAATTATAADVEAPSTPLNSSLLSPSRFKNRKFNTPKSNSKSSAKVLQTPPSAQSVISSTCDISPGNYHLDEVRSPIKSEISSFFQGTPPPSPEQDGDVFRMITTGGGSPIPASKTQAEHDETEVPTGSDTGDEQAQSSGERPTGNESAVQKTDEAEQNIVVAPAESFIEMTDMHSGLATQGALPESNNITEAAEQISSEDDKESAVVPTEETTSIASPAIDLTDDNEDVEANTSSPSTDPALQTPERKLAQLTIDDDKHRTPEPPTPKASPHSVERTTRRTRAEAKRELLRKEKHLYNIAELAAEWEDRIQHALQHGHGDFTASDFTRVVPLPSSNNRGTDRWLNDEVINGYLKLVVKHGRQNDRPAQVPSYHAFSSFFFNNLEEKGHESVKRWGVRAKIGGKNLLETEGVFIPINSGAHWTLLVVSGKARSATHYNSMAGSGRRYIAAVKTWLAGELGSQYKEEEWTFVERGESPMQSNMDDCGVFTITSARQIMLGLTPMSYGPEMIPLQRKRIVAELVAGELLKSSV